MEQLNVGQQSAQGSQTSAKVKNGSGINIGSAQGSKTFQAPSASLIFAKSHEKVADLLPSEFDESGGTEVDDEDYLLGDGDDWNLPVPLLRARDEGEGGQEGAEAEELLRQRGKCLNELDVTASVTDIDWCVKDMRNETRHVVERLQRAIAGSIDDILRRMYEARPSMVPMEVDETAASVVRAAELIDRCYYEKFTDVKCKVSSRKLRQVLTAMQLDNALELLDLLETAAVSDRIVIELAKLRKSKEVGTSSSGTSKPDETSVIRRAIGTIIDNLNVDMCFLNGLKARRVINDQILTDVLCMPNRPARVLRISEHLLQLGPHAMQECGAVLVKCGYRGLAGVLQNLLVQ